MLFTSYAFVAFVAVVAVLYYVLPKKAQWPLLLLASYVFYFIAGPSFLIYITATVVSTWYAGLRIGRIGAAHAADAEAGKATRSKEDRKAVKAKAKAKAKAKQRAWLVACLLFNFGILAVVKYSNFAIFNVNSLLAAFGSPDKLSFLTIALPMGISFYTFKTMSYLIDLYRGKFPAERNVFRLALFTSFFPQLVQGPISRFDDLSKSLFEEHRFDRRVVLSGLQRILWGFFKKLVIADRILAGVTTLIKNPDQYTGAFVLVGMLFYALQLYADFTGGIDITIGISEMLGIKVAENFNAPFLSRNITDYWRRWHITMGTWFRDYIFYPMSVAQPMLRLSRWCREKLGEGFGKRVTVYLATLVTWFATGVWHGSSWNFIAWGLANGFVIILSHECEPLYKRFHARFHWKGKPAYTAFEVVRTVLLMSSIRLFDCYRDVPLTFRMFGTMFTTFNYGRLFDGTLLKIGLSGADYAVLGVGLAVLIGSRVVKDRTGDFRERLAAGPAWVRTAATFALILAILVLGAYGIGYDAKQFIYNQF